MQIMTMSTQVFLLYKNPIDKFILIWFVDYDFFMGPCARAKTIKLFKYFLNLFIYLIELKTFL